MNDSTSPVLNVARKRANADGIITLYDGTKIKVVPVSAMLIDEVTRQIPFPEVPVVHDEVKGDLPNPSHPEYGRKYQEAMNERTRAAMSALVMFGVVLVDGLPQDDEWVKKLKFLEKRKLIDLTGYDFEDVVDKEFLYKRFIAVDSDIFAEISRVSGVSGEEIKAAEESFRGTESGRTD